MPSDLPRDLAHPRHERAHLIANVVTGLALLGILTTLLLVVTPWLES